MRNVISPMPIKKENIRSNRSLSYLGSSGHKVLLSEKVPLIRPEDLDTMLIRSWLGIKMEQFDNQKIPWTYQHGRDVIRS
jgi:hypothetical protein